ncbi:MAG: nuclear transport factor 2 family protein [Acidimicrobiales bacterium]|nr:nuclear transport factor 2 family protein [Acidimicrobiales bacterium]
MGDDLDQLLAEREIRRRLLDYCRGVDTADAALVASAYHADSYDDHGSFQGDGPTFAAYVTNAVRDRYEATQHVIDHATIDFVDDNTAAVETYVVARHVHRDEAGPLLTTFGGMYRDRFERRKGDWRIARREVLHSWDKVERVEPGWPAGHFAERPRVQ